MAGSPKSLEHVLTHMVWANAVPGVVAILSAAAIFVTGAIAGFVVDLNVYSLVMIILGPSSVLLWLLGASVWELLRARPQTPTRHLLNKLRYEWAGGARLMRGLPILALYPVFFGAFTSYKSALGKFVPFYFDPYAAQIDRLLHGQDAWLFFGTIFNYPVVIFLLNFLYNLWFLTIYITLAIVAFVVSDLRLRSQYLTSFIACWVIIGVLAATLLSSAGPCYIRYFFGDSSFDYIFKYLMEVSTQYPVPALATQQLLLQEFNTNEPGIGVGISAAPSMHVSIAALNAIFLSRYGKFAAIAGWGYCAAIFVGSVQLGWHYAIDGYISLVLTPLIWALSGVLVASMHSAAEAPHSLQPAGGDERPS